MFATKYPRRLMSAIIAAAVAGLVLVAGSALAEAKDKVRISGLTWPGYGFWYIAMAKNLAPDLELTYQRIEDPYESFNLITADQMDVVSSTVEFTPIGVERGMPLRLVAFANLSYGTDKIVVAPGIDGPDDLKGKEVAVLEGGLAQIYMAMWLEQNGVKFDAVKYRNIIADDAFAAMVGGSIAASEFWEPYGSNTLKALPGSKVAAQSREPYWLKHAVVADGLFMSSKFTTERRDVARKTLKALYDAIAWWEKNPAEGNKIISEGMKMSLADVELVIGKDGTGLDGGLYVYDFLEAARFCGSAPGNPPFEQKNGQMDEHWKLMSEWWLKFGLIKKIAAPDTGVECQLHKELHDAGYRG
ncbi:MAG: ABC transporter substrate-binding protein [Hyphomicrobiaceae bacterium]